ncbi:TIR domain-containing protein [Methanolobus sediminis]|uniref:TIR domain-containing protein n=1 Tax=Methanolobus sediminis TaxID=3072978 RepID=A0AA51ULM1_9EURY|nr:TIR domain-containing protein [Methanolobus sediminis]WMW25852.1 TIR domain-containing protein [Methanolobus sediminis]
MGDKHKVFVSYHHKNDQYYRDEFENILSSSDIAVLRSVQIGDIDDQNLSDERIRQIIRDQYLRDPTVTIVLIGTETWKRKHVDWEIGSSIRNTEKNPRAGLLGILLPSHPDHNTGKFTSGLIPPRLYDNFQCDYAKIYNWTSDPASIKNMIHAAFETRNQNNPDNSRTSFRRNHSGESWC